MSRNPPGDIPLPIALGLAMLHLALWLGVGLAIIGCGPEPDEPTREPAADPIPQVYEAAGARTASEFINGARVVSIGAEPGDGLFFAGVWLSAAPCAAGDALELELTDEIVARNGIISRHPSMPDSVSLDGAIALWAGAAERIVRCGKAAVWREPIRLHRAYVQEHNGRMNPGSSAFVVPEFDYVLERLANYLGLAPRPSPISLAALELEVGAWARQVVRAKAACFRINLGYTVLRTAERLGDDVRRAPLCSGAAGADIPLIDHWCARGDLKAYVASYVQDQWEYRHQRCGSWEAPDGRGLRHPGVDLQIAIREAYLVP